MTSDASCRGHGPGAEDLHPGPDAPEGPPQSGTPKAHHTARVALSHHLFKVVRRYGPKRLPSNEPAALRPRWPCLACCSRRAIQVFRHPFTRPRTPAAVRRSRAPAACYPAFSSTDSTKALAFVAVRSLRTGEDAPIRLLQPTRVARAPGRIVRRSRWRDRLRGGDTPVGDKSPADNPSREAFDDAPLSFGRKASLVRRRGDVRWARVDPTGPRSRVPRPAPPGMRRCLPLAGRARSL